MPLKLKPYDVVEYLKTEGDVRHYLEAAIEDGDPEVIKSAAANVERARRMWGLQPESTGTSTSG